MPLEWCKGSSDRELDSLDAWIIEGMGVVGFVGK